jgi:short-subunit dehydrogenase
VGDATPFADRYGPWAIVLGASAGIGLGAADEAAARGLDVVLVARAQGVAGKSESRREAVERMSAITSAIWH